MLIVSTEKKSVWQNRDIVDYFVGNKAKGNVVFRKRWRALLSWNTRFEIRPFALLPTISGKITDGEFHFYAGVVTLMVFYVKINSTGRLFLTIQECWILFDHSCMWSDYGTLFTTLSTYEMNLFPKIVKLTTFNGYLFSKKLHLGCLTGFWIRLCNGKSLFLDAMSWFWIFSAIFSLDGTFTEPLNIAETTCYANEFRVENCSLGEVGEQRQCQNGSCVGLDGRKYLPNEYEIVYRNCTLVDYCEYPPRKHFKRFWGRINLT